MRFFSGSLVHLYLQKLCTLNYTIDINEINKQELDGVKKADSKRA